MADTDKAAPRPWRKHPEHAGCLIGPPPHGHMIVDCTDTRTSQEEWEANSALVLRAVNSFDAVVAALKTALPALQRALVESEGSGYFARAIAYVTDALALAEAP